MHPAGEQLADWEVLFWMLICKGRSELPKVVSWDRYEQLYHQESGMFAPPSWPASIPLALHVIGATRPVGHDCPSPFAWHCEIGVHRSQHTDAYPAAVSVHFLLSRILCTLKWWCLWHMWSTLLTFILMISQSTQMHCKGREGSAAQQMAGDHFRVYTCLFPDDIMLPWKPPQCSTKILC